MRPSSRAFPAGARPRARSFEEAVSALRADEAHAEAGRCLRCDIRETASAHCGASIGATLWLSKSRFASTASLYAATEGQTIFQVAAASGRTIPSLCYLEGLSSPGACRLCLVEVAGVGRLLPACTTPARRRHVRRHQLRDARAPPPDGAGTAVHRTQPRLLRLRLQRALRTAVDGAEAGDDACRLSVQLPAAAGGHVASAIRAGPQSLHPVLALRAGVR